MDKYPLCGHKLTEPKDDCIFCLCFDAKEFLVHSDHEVTVVYEDRSRGLMVFKNGRWNHSEPHQPDHATQTGMYDHW